MRRRPYHNRGILVFTLRIHTTMHAMDLLYLEPLLARHLLFYNPCLLKEHIRAVVHCARIAFVGAFFTARYAELRKLDLTRCFLVGGCNVTQVQTRSQLFCSFSAHLDQ